MKATLFILSLLIMGSVDADVNDINDVLAGEYAYPSDSTIAWECYDIGAFTYDMAYFIPSDILSVPADGNITDICHDLYIHYYN